MSRSCPTNSVPSAFEGLPTDQTYGVIPGRNASSPWMVNCCSPNPVQIVDECWSWCELPKSITKGSRDQGKINDDFNLCLSNNGRRFNESNGVSIHIAASAATAPVHVSVAGVLVASLLALGSMAL
ncbi:hypothetical protein CMUS01_07917 [Colletotrichum musicola]|uniref:Uncharacterized protein n=1 Tax=Colletotrichum musicola TaxID=2175873 RepID=A0A8H6KEY2_9PEZI|nr:hypothetical protein CMUS01_07917 [Colletotrichum musicola]